MPTKTETESTAPGWTDAAFLKKVKAAFDADEEATDKDVADKLGVARGQVVLGRMRLAVPVKDRKILTDDDEITKAVVPLRRSESLSWGDISARLGVPESRVRSLYTNKTGEDSRGLRIGKGGRYPGDDNGSARPAKKAVGKKAAAKKAAAPAKKAVGKKAAAKKATSNDPADGSILPRKSLVEMNLAELKARINGQTVTVGRRGKAEKIQVKNVTGLKGTEMSFVQVGGKGRTIDLANVTTVSR